MHFKKSGTEASEQLLLLHGWGSSSELMEPLARQLEGRYFVVNVDLPGHGRSPAPETPWGIPEYADEVAQLIRTNMRPPVSVIGHSNGGRIALYMASEPEYRTLIKRLILISPSGMRPSPSMKVKAKRAVARALKLPFSVLPAGLESRGLEWLRGSALWRSLGSSDYRSLSGVMRETFVRTVNTHLDDSIHKIEVPTLVFWGSRDTEVTRDQVDRLVAQIPDAGLVVLEDAGHYGYLDQPATVLAGFNHFLENS